MTKAERLFKKNYFACKRHIEFWGFKGIGFGTLECDENDLLPTRTLNDIQKQIDKQRKHLEMCRKLNVGIDEIELKEQALEMVQITLDNQRRVNEEWKAI